MDTLPRNASEYRTWWEANTDVPYGYCWCGCGEATSEAGVSSLKQWCRKGEPRRFVYSHHLRHYFLKRDRFKVEDRGYETPCWIWQLKVNQYGYGNVVVGGRDKMAHRHSYEIHKGKIPVGLTIDHLCRVRDCVNPNHLEAVTMHVNQRRGSRTVLSVELVEALRLARSHGVELPVLETLTGIKRRTIRAALDGENWTK